MKYILKKIVYGLLVLWGVITIVFVLFNILPDDPARLTLGQRSDLSSIENVRKELNLDKPVIIRYILYLNDLSPISCHLTEDVQRYESFMEIKAGHTHSILGKMPYLGRSYQSKKLVSEILGEALPGTLILGFSAMLFATLIGIGLGVFSALKKGTIWDTSAIMASVVGISTPSFFAGIILAFIFGYLLNEYTHLNMVGSLFEYNNLGEKKLALKNLILPAITLGIRPLAIIAQLTRSALLDVLHQDYIRTAKAKGVPQRKIIIKHALPNAMNPVVTAVSGWLAELLAGSFFAEYVFGWKGLGRVTVDALEKFDFPIVMGTILIAACIFIIVNMLTDLVYAFIDPRIKLE